MSKLAEVSIVMPAYNAEKTIAGSVASALSQSFAGFELIIVDDCSEDGTHIICEELAAADGRIRLFKNSANKGVAYSRNFGVEKAVGRWIAFLDSDDLWGEEKLERQLAFMGETGAAISYTATGFVGSEGQAYKYVLRARRELTYNGLLGRNLMSCSSVVVRRDLIASEPFLDGQLHEDYVAWLKIVQLVGVAYGLDEPLLTYRLSKASRSGPRVRSGLMVYRAYQAVGYGSAAAALMTLRYAVHSMQKRFRLWLE
jgi:teichuronic acid biosynthesis glycosyltransferase TuaG